MTMPGNNPNVLPLMPPRATSDRVANFDQTVFTADPSTVVYKLVDALCGDAGAGSLNKEALVSRLGTSLDSIYFSDLDSIFGNIGFVGRFVSEQYPYDPMSDMLTSDQWDEVAIKDATYRNRIKMYFMACSKGGTPDGIRLCVQSVLSVDCDIYEEWHFMDNFGLTASIGRAPAATRSEVIIKPHITTMTQPQHRILKEMLRRLMPADVIVTINLGGLEMHNTLKVMCAAADSSYFEIQKTITGSPILANLPPPELLAIDLDPSEKWLLTGSPELAPYAAFNISQEYGYYYLVSGGARSPINSVRYGTLQSDGTVKAESNLDLFNTIGQYTAWISYETADSPDNYPGGKFGLTPTQAPALNSDGSAYVFSWPSQDDYANDMLAQVVAKGGQGDTLHYRLPITAQSTSKVTFTPDLAVAYNPPVKDSTVTCKWHTRSGKSWHEFQDTRTFTGG